jgi:REP element-mobilizing transposase RayT
MANNDIPDHLRRSIRLPGYDYTQAGAYFVTIVTWQRECLFGEIVCGEMALNDFGSAARDEWFKTVETRRNVVLHPDEMLVMPNHIHGIIWILGTQGRIHAVGAQRRCAPTEFPNINDKGSKGTNVTPGSLGAIIRAYKSAVTRRINILRRTAGSPVWQRNYYERIIRAENEFKRIRAYIEANPRNWLQDEENP